LKEEQEILDVEAHLEELYFVDFAIFPNEDCKFKVNDLERKKKIKLLAIKEVDWRLDSRALWLEKGDNNTIFS
jgi:hypothetical protein